MGSVHQLMVAYAGTPPFILAMGTDAFTTSGASVTPTLPAVLAGDFMIAWGSRSSATTAFLITTAGWNNFVNLTHYVCAWKRATSSVETNPTIGSATTNLRIRGQCLAIRNVSLITDNNHPLISSGWDGVVSTTLNSNNNAVGNNDMKLALGATLASNIALTGDAAGRGFTTDYVGQAASTPTLLCQHGIITGGAMSCDLNSPSSVDLAQILIEIKRGGVLN